MKIERNKNHELHVVMYSFVAMFFLMMGYFVYYVSVQSQEQINNSYNMRQENLAKKVIRGKILSNDRQVLAETILDVSGNEVRRYPYGKLFAHAVGYSTKGKTGVEAEGNIKLLTSNAYVVERLQNDIDQKKNIGDNLVTTFDIHLQQVASEALGVYKGSIVVMEPKTGRILAMVSKPDFDPNTLLSDWEQINQQTEKSPLLNRATQGLYPPGSTFKIVTLLEYLREHDDAEQYRFTCNGKYTKDDVTVNCYHNSVHGVVDIHKSFAKSCNCSFANMGLDLDTAKYQKTCKELLFDGKIPLKVPYKESEFTLSRDSDLEKRMHTSIGQGDTLITPAMITSAIANKGVLQTPIMIDQVENYNGEVVKQYHPSEYKRLISEEEASTLTEYMVDVVENGTGSKLSGQSYTVAGKTGSAEFGTTKGESHAWFTGFSSAEDPDIVVTVIVEGAGSGGDYAVPMAKRIFDAYYK